MLTMVATAAAAAVLMMAGVQTPSQQRAPVADPRADAPVVLTGCLSTSTDRKRTRFMLINMSPAPAGGEAARTSVPEAGSTGVGTTGTGTSGSGAAPSPTTAQDTAQVSVLLTSEPNISLRRHVNRRVEVQGRVTGGADAPRADEPREVHVMKLRRLPGACSSKK